ncbi:MAG: AraC family transcriptional regulator [Bacteroidetes bacterium]|nr:MAG: AraC family transcriptional regulator [Bacteroidota bacterium]
MIVEHKTFDLFEKMAFEKAVLVPPVTMPAFMHNEACFFYVLDGKQKSIGATESADLKKNEGVLLKCGNFYSQFYEAGDNGQVEAVAVHFYPEVLKKVYDTGLPQFLKAPKSELPKTSMAVIKGDVMIQKYIESLLFYFENPVLANEELLVLKLKELILLLSKTEYAVQVHDILSTLFSPQTYEFKEIINANIYSDLSVEQLAGLTNRSLSSFKREFKKVFNASPASYLKSKKLEKAAELLLTTDIQISHIAYDCGFADQAHFSKSFKQEFGISPSNYRLNQINNNLN